MRKSNLLILAIMFCYGFIVSSCGTVEDNPTVNPQNPQPVDTKFDYYFDLSTDGGTVMVSLFPHVKQLKTIQRIIHNPLIPSLITISTFPLTVALPG